MANVTPIHKKDNKQALKNYRPIFLLPIFAKVFERLIFHKLYNHLVSNNRITKNQSGFRPNHSVTNQFTSLVEGIHSSLDCKLEVRLVYLDMPKAFAAMEICINMRRQLCGNLRKSIVLIPEVGRQ